jgi:hypothetical protein
MGWRVKSLTASSTTSRADFSNPGKTRRISRSVGSRTKARGGVIFISYAVSYGALGGWETGWRWWYSSYERQMGTRGRGWINRPIFSPALPMGRPFKPSVSPTSLIRSQVMKSSNFARTPTSSYPLEILSPWLLSI